MDVPAELRITITDVTRAGFCARGARRWFEANGIDFRTFVRDGIAAADLMAVGDALAERVVAGRLGRSGG